MPIRFSSYHDDKRIYLAFTPAWEMYRVRQKSLPLLRGKEQMEEGGKWNIAFSFYLSLWEFLIDSKLLQIYIYQCFPDFLWLKWKKHIWKLQPGPLSFPRWSINYAGNKRRKKTQIITEIRYCILALLHVTDFCPL